MKRMLVNAPPGDQRLITVGEGGGYYDLARVVWDERIDGPLPEITLGGMVRQGDALVLDNDLLAAAQAAATAAARAAAWERIKARRDHLSDTGGYMVAVNGADKWFHSDPKSKTQQLGLFVMGASVPAVQWKTMDGTFVVMTQALAAAVFQAAAVQDQALFAVAEQHRVAMEASADPWAYDFSGGWPVVFVQ